MFSSLTHQIKHHYMAIPMLNKFLAMHEIGNNPWDRVESEMENMTIFIVKKIDPNGSINE